jgi:SAM-dependent methyltransferase
MDRDAWNRRYEGAELLWTAQPNRFLAEEAADLPAGRALDLAAGEGRNAVWLAQGGWRVTAVDFAPAALAKARELADARGVPVEWVEADVLAYEPEAGGFDLVVILYLHLPRPDLAVVLHRAAAALAPGGTLLVVGHDRTNLAEGHGGPQDEAVLYDPDELAREVSDLHIERAERVRRPVQTDAGTVVAIDALLRAVRR